MDTMIYVFQLLALVIGAFSCFSGYRVLKSIVPVCSFAVGAAIGVIVAVNINILIGISVMIVLGLMLSVVSFKLYKVGVFSVVAFLAGIAAYLVSYDIFISCAVSVVLGVISLLLIKHISIVVTAVSGATVVIWSAVTLVDFQEKEYFLIWVVLLFILSLSGILCQYLTSYSESENFKDGMFGMICNHDDVNFSSGMQRAYRNYCIKCGYEMDGLDPVCPRCGFNFEN